MKSFSSKGRQGGTTLVGMMVGLVISLLTIAAMLAVYKMMIEISGNASRTAVRDGQVALSMLSAQIEMQQAGFGIAAGDPQPVIHVPASTESADQRNRVVWRFRPAASSTTSCSGVEILRVVDGARRPGVYLMTPAACASPDGWVAEEHSLLASEEVFFVPQDRDGNAFTDEAGVDVLDKAVFALRTGASGDGCSLPYAQQVSGAAPSSQQVVLLADAEADARVIFSVCLPNIAATAAGVSS